jgi:hypothetical protein
MSSWREHHPAWEYTLWDDANRPALINEDAFAAAPSWAMKADILRYELLLVHGGVYVDADFECHRPLEALVEDRSILLVSEFGIVCNGVMGCEPGSGFIETIVTEASRCFLAASTKERLQPHLVTGPHLVDRVFVESGLVERDPDCLVAGDYFFEPRSRVPEALALAMRKRFATHHALASWRRESSLTTMLKQTKLRTRLKRFTDLTAP